MLWSKVFFAITAFIATVLTVSPARSEQKIQNLQDGNYKFCSIPPPQETLTEEEFFIQLQTNNPTCFLFNKQGDIVVGDLYTTQTFGEDGICVGGKVNNNTLSGKASVTFYEGADYVKINTEEAIQSTRKYWLEKQVLSITESEYFSENVEFPYVVFKSALLNLNGFYRYRAGTKLPSSSCMFKLLQTSAKVR